MTDAKRRQRPKRRPRPMPPPIPDTPENVAKAVLNTPPRKPDEWEYMKRGHETADVHSDDQA